MRRGIGTYILDAGCVLSTSAGSIDAFFDGEAQLPQPSDVVVLDVDLGRPDEFVPNFKRLNEGGYEDIVIYTTVYQAEPLRKALGLGARALVAKADDGKELVVALSTLKSSLAAGGDRRGVIITSFMAKVIEGSGVRLSPREQEVLRAVRSGMSYGQVADFYGLTKGTVHSTLQDAFRRYAEDYPEIRLRPDGTSKRTDMGVVDKLAAKDGYLPHTNLDPPIPPPRSDGSG